MRLRTPLCSLLGIDLPIVQAPIGSVTSPELAAAVSEAGGLGMLAMTWREIPEVRRVMRETRERTRHPFGVNLVLAWPQEERLQACLEEGARIVSFSFGDPRPLLPAVKDAGALSMQMVGSAAAAREAAEAGVDIVVAQGTEAGGHLVSDVSLFALLPRVVDAAAPTPVLAAGGVADGRGLAAALCLGAAGVYVGTRFLLSAEARLHAIYRERLLAANETDTLRSIVFDALWPDTPHRTLENSTTRMWRAAGMPPRGKRPEEDTIVAESAAGQPLTRYTDATPIEGTRGDAEALALYAGEGVGLTSSVQPAASIVREMAVQACGILQAGTCLVNHPWEDDKGD